jgi:hypothetical protein
MILRGGRDSASDCSAAGASWIHREIAGCELADVRLGRRLRNLLEQIGDAVGESIPLACEDWANTKAAYRFLSNDRVNEEDILSGHLQAARDRFASSTGFIFVLHDTTEFSFQRERPDLIGVTYNVNSGRDKAGRIRSRIDLRINEYTPYARAAAASSANVIAAAISASFRSSWPRDVRSLSSSASILIARIPLRSWRPTRVM